MINLCPKERKDVHLFYLTIIFVTFLLLISPFFWYGRYYEPFLLDIKEIEISNENDLRVLQFSDFHYGRGFNLEQVKNVIDAINESDHDLVIFSGDLFSNTFRGDLQPLINEFKRIKSKHKYAVWGNHDYKKFAKFNFDRVFEEAGFTVLKDEHEIITIGERRLNIVGTDDFRDGSPDVNHLHTLNEDTYDYSIMITHVPDAADEFVDDNYDLILSGHTHGGQVRLPYDIRGTTKMGRNYIDGLFHLNDDTKLYVSSGLGSSVMRMRFRVIPSISILNI